MPKEIVYNNIIFIFDTEEDKSWAEILIKNRNKDGLSMRNIADWLNNCGCSYDVKYRYKKGWPVRLNLLGWIIYKGIKKKKKKRTS